jgi:hypothetical protein
MATVTFTTRGNLVAGNTENIGDVTDCLDKLLAGVNSVDDAQLASANNSTWKNLFIAQQTASAGSMVSGTTYLALTGSPNWIAVGSATGTPYVMYYIDTADLAVTGKTLKVRLKAAILTNSTAPGINITYGLSNITGASGSPTLALGVAAALTEVTLTTPPAQSGATGNSTETTFSTSGYYGIHAKVSGSAAANSLWTASLTAQYRHV